MKTYNKKLNLILIFLSLFAFNSCETKTEKNRNIKQDKKKINTLSDKKIYDFIEGSPKLNPNQKMGQPFSSLNFDKLIAYEYEDSPKEDPYASIIMDGKYIPTITKQKKITQKQAEILLSKLSDEKSYELQPAMCFYPRMSLIFYRESKIINVIDICLDCNLLSSNIEIPNQSKDVPGFSKFGRQAIIDFSREIGFKYGEYESF